MFVLDLTVDQWVGNKNEGNFIENPTWEQIESAICELDGQTKTLVTLGADEETYMTIGGGEGDRYIVNVTFDNIKFYNLVDRAQRSQIEKLVVGGQLGDYPASICADLKTVLLAAKTFTISGFLEESVTWEDSESLAMAGQVR